MPTLAENIFKSFRTPGSVLNSGVIAGGKISKTFDEPTYLTFRLGFRPANTNLELTNYDKMPHPLFERAEPQDDINARNFYSTRQFLRDANEFVREKMLLEFIDKWNVVQNNYQWYFQSISGIDSLLKIDPKRGIRVSKDGKVTIKMFEGLDWKIIHLLNLYRKIAWDDVYQRWILPDMMRYFMMDIYITEFRTFHQSTLTTNPSEQKPKTFPGSEVPNMVLTAIDDLMPTYVIHCERCEFDITSFNSQFNDLNVTDPQMAEISFDIKVGTITEEYRNSILDYYYTDRIINGLERSVEFSMLKGESIPVNLGGVSVPIIMQEDIPYNPLKISANTEARAYINPDMDYGEKASHTSGQPFVETGGSGESNLSNASQAIQPPTWIGNTIKFGKAFAENLLDTAVGKAKMTKIPGLGVSFNEALAAAQSKNIFVVFGLVRQAMTQDLAPTMPSQELSNKLIDTSFREFVSKIAKSEATNGTENLVRAANKILNDQGIWEEIKDMSKATDLISQIYNEVNIGKSIENPEGLKSQVNILTSNDRSKATDLDGDPTITGQSLVYKGIPLSTSTSGSIEGKTLSKVKIGSTDGNIQKDEGQETNPSVATSVGYLEKSSFSEIKPNLGIEEGGLESAAPSLATSKRDELQKPNFTGSKPKSEIQGGEIEDAEVSKATKSDIENGKYFFGGISKNELVKEKLPRPKPSEDLSEPIKNK